jgi:hypothetical protein
MRWLLTAGFIGGVVWLAFAYYSQHGQRFVTSPVATPAQPEAQEPQKVRAATPEDPGPIATVMGPLAEWTKDPKDTKPASSAPAKEPWRADSPFDRAERIRHLSPKVLVHKTFPVMRFSAFTFVIPAHVNDPQLHGSFASFVQSGSNEPGVSRPAAVDLLLLNTQELRDFNHGERGTATRTVTGTSSSQVDWALGPTFDQPRSYTLVFRNAETEENLFVKADFVIRY